MPLPPSRLKCIGLAKSRLPLGGAPRHRSDWSCPHGAHDSAWIATHLSSARLPGGIALAFREVEWRQDLTERAIHQLRFIVDGFLTRFEYQHLVNIRDGQEYGVKKEDSGALAAELRRLMSLGLIAKISDDHGVRDFTQADGRKRRIEKWFRLTPRGEEYLRMRTDNERDAAAGVEPATAPGASPLPEKAATL
jgi:DNA-binding PadR family transcriptional regulator